MLLFFIFLSNEQPAIGIILSEAMKYLITGKWWLALFPGIMLVITVYVFIQQEKTFADCWIRQVHTNRRLKWIRKKFWKSTI